MGGRASFKQACRFAACEAVAGTTFPQADVCNGEAAGVAVAYPAALGRRRLGYAGKPPHNVLEQGRQASGPPGGQAWTLPELLSVASFAETEFADYVGSTLTTFRQPGESLASMAPRSCCGPF